MSNLTPTATVRNVLAEAQAGTFDFNNEQRIGSAGYIRGVMYDVISGVYERPTNCYGMRGWVMSQIPVAILDATDRIVTPVDSTKTVTANRVTLSTGAIEVDSVAAGDGIVVVNGAWIIYGTTEETIVTPVDSTISVEADHEHFSTGAIEIDSVAAGDGIVIVDGIWTIRASTLIETPIDERIRIEPAALFTSTGAIEVDSAAPGDGVLRIYGLWTLN